MKGGPSWGQGRQGQERGGSNRGRCPILGQKLNRGCLLAWVEIRPSAWGWIPQARSLRGSPL